MKKKTNISKRYKESKVREGHNRPGFDGTQHIEEASVKMNTVIYSKTERPLVVNEITQDS